MYNRFISLEGNIEESNHKSVLYYDTGSSYFLIDSQFYDLYDLGSLRFHNLYKVEPEGLVKSNSVYMFYDELKFNLDQILFTSNQSMLLDVKTIFGAQVDGIVGLNSFKDIRHKIDYVEQHISFDPVLKGYEEIDIKYDGHFILVPLEITFYDGNKLTGDFILDTGSGNTQLKQELLEIESISNNGQKATYDNHDGLRSYLGGYSFFVENIAIGAYNIKNFVIDIPTDPQHKLPNQNEILGLLGNDLLDDFDVVIHAEEKKLWLRPNKNFNKNVDKLYYGFSVQDRTDKSIGWVVTSVYELSDSYTKGLRVHDVITSIDNIAVEKLNMHSYFKNLKPNQELALRVKRNGVILEYSIKLNVFLTNDNS